MNIRPSFIIIQDQKILCLRYNYNGVKVYTLPGGNLETGEPMVECLIREMVEELNIQTSASDLVFVAEINRNNKYTIHTVFEGKIVSGMPVINPKETIAEDFEWLPISELENCNLYPKIGKSIVEKYLQNTPVSVYLGVIEQPWY